MSICNELSKIVEDIKMVGETIWIEHNRSTDGIIFESLFGFY